MRYRLATPGRCRCRRLRSCRGRLVPGPGRTPGSQVRPGVDDGDEPETARGQTREHARGVREGLRVPGEHPVAVHVLDIQPEGVARDRAFAMALGDLLHRL